MASSTPNVVVTGYVNGTQANFSLELGGRYALNFKKDDKSPADMTTCVLIGVVPVGGIYAARVLFVDKGQLNFYDNATIVYIDNPNVTEDDPRKKIPVLSVAYMPQRNALQPNDILSMYNIIAGKANAVQKIFSQHDTIVNRAA